MVLKYIPKSVLWFGLLLVLLIPTISSLLRPGYFPMHDDMQAMRLLQMDKCIKDGQVPCRWVPDMGYGYGYPQFNYYAPLPYYVMEVFHLAGFGFLDSVKSGFVVSVFLSAIGMFLLGKSLWGAPGGFISALFYTYAPYRALNMYVRGAVGEFWAMGFLPLVFWSTREVMAGKKYGILGLALSLAGLFTSHNITALIFVPILFAWVIFLLLNGNKNRVKDIILGIVWGVSISAFFILPAWFEKGFAHIETLTQGYFGFQAHFVSISQLLFSTFWGYGSSELGPYDGISLAVGLLHWIFPLLALGLLWYLKKKKFRLVAFFVIVGWISLFFAHQRSALIWSNISILAFLQFPWRFLTLATFSFSIAAGAISILFSKKHNFIYAFAILPVLLLFYASYFQPRTWLTITDEDKFGGDSWEKQLTISIFDYLPIYAKYPPDQKAPEEPTIIEGDGKVISGEKGTNWQMWKVDILSSEATVRLPLYDFPGFRAWIDGKQTFVDHNNELGLITIKVPKGEHEILARLTDTPVRKIGNILSFAGLVAVPAFLIRKKKR